MRNSNINLSETIDNSNLENYPKSKSNEDIL